jgi:hypothetical protein
VASNKIFGTRALDELFKQNFADAIKNLIKKDFPTMTLQHIEYFEKNEESLMQMFAFSGGISSVINPNSYAFIGTGGKSYHFNNYTFTQWLSDKERYSSPLYKAMNENE